MEPHEARAGAAIARNGDWRKALREAVDSANASLQGARPDLAFLFVSSRYGDEVPDIAIRAGEEIGARHLVGCTGQGVIGTSEEIEGEPAITLLALTLPGAEPETSWLYQSDLDQLSTRGFGVGDVAGVAAWLILADPFSFDVERLINHLSSTAPGVPIIGGVASGDPQERETHLFLQGRVDTVGAVVVAIRGPWSVETVVSQGAAPIGQPWTITEAEGQVIQSIAGRPALEVLMETLQGLPPSEQERAQRNLLVGLAMDEYRDDFGRGDFLIRNVMGADRESGALAIGALPRAGQTLQFQMRDAAAADDELRVLLNAKRASFETTAPVAALLYSCNGRGAALFGAPHHDALTVGEFLGPLPLAGFFCNGEIGPVGGKPFLHGFTASIAFFVPKR